MIRDTSREAYQSLQNINDKQKQVLNAIAKLQPCSDLGISEFLGWPINRITPRRGELEKLGLINAFKKVVNINNRSVWQWKINAKPVQGSLW